MIKISDAELEVMKVIWNRGKATSVEIIEDLTEQQKTNWSYNTIRTLIKRLLVKGAIEIIKKEGKKYTYKPMINEDEYKIDIVRRLLDKMYHGSFNELVVEYCDTDLTLKEVKELKKNIDEMVDKKK